MSADHYTLVLEIQRVTYTGNASPRGTPDKSVDETARVVIRDPDLYSLVAKALQHLDIIRGGPAEAGARLHTSATYGKEPA